MTLNRYNPKRDLCEHRIVQALQKQGVMVRQLSDEGIPDLLCRLGSNYFFVECKAKGKALSRAQALFFAEARYHKAHAYVAHEAADADWIIDMVLGR